MDNPVRLNVQSLEKFGNNASDFEKQQRQIPVLSKGIQYISAGEYAGLVGMHKVTVLKYLAKGRVSGAVKVGGRWRIPVTD